MDAYSCSVNGNITAADNYNIFAYVKGFLFGSFVKEFNCKIVESEIIPSENQVDKKLPVICMILTKE